jgi:hypothetical protein
MSKTIDREVLKQKIDAGEDFVLIEEHLNGALAVDWKTDRGYSVYEEEKT